MNLQFTIDVGSILGTLASTLVGAWLAFMVMRRQIDATRQVERDNARRNHASALIEALDSYVHIAYRSHDGEARRERQRLHRRIESLVALCLPHRLADVQQHLGLVEAWNRGQRGGPRVKGAGLSATDVFVTDMKVEIFRNVFDTHMAATRLGADEERRDGD